MVKVEISLANFYRLLHPYRATLISCTSEDGKVNVMAAAWVMPLSRNPPLLAVSIAPSRYTHELIRKTGEFVVNIPTAELIDQVYLCGSISGRETDKLAKAGLTTEKAKEVKSPLIKECIAHIECKLEKEVEAGDHTLFIARVLRAIVDEGVFDVKRCLYKLEKAKPLLHLGGRLFTTAREVREAKG